MSALPEIASGFPYINSQDEWGISPEVNYTEYLFNQASQDVFKVRSLLANECSKYMKNQDDIIEILTAFDFSFYFHDREAKEEKKRFRGTISAYTGEKQQFMVHPGAVAQILSEWKCDKDTIIGGLLHDGIEDTNVTLDEIKLRFGDDVTSAVDSLTKVTDITSDLSEIKSLGKLIQAFVADPRVVLIKLADRLHNMRTIGGLPLILQEQFARRTLVFAFLARALAMHDVADELEERCYRVLAGEKAIEAENHLSAYSTHPVVEMFSQLDQYRETITWQYNLPAFGEFFAIAEDGQTIIIRNPQTITVDIVFKNHDDDGLYKELTEFFRKHNYLLPDIFPVDGRLELTYPQGSKNLKVRIFSNEGFLQKEASLTSLYQLEPTLPEFVQELYSEYDRREMLEKMKNYAVDKSSRLQERLHQYQKGRSWADVAWRLTDIMTEKLIFVRDVNLGKPVVVVDGWTVMDMALNYGPEYALRIRSVKVNDKRSTLWRRLKEGEQVVFQPKIEEVEQNIFRYPMRLRVSYLNKLKYAENKIRIGVELRNILNLDRDIRRGLYSEAETASILSSLGLKSIADFSDYVREIRQDAEDRGEKKIVTTGKWKPKVDIDRVWNKMMHADITKLLKSRYEKLTDFLIAVGLEEVFDGDVQSYREELKLYEKNLPEIPVDLPDHPAMLGVVALVVGQWANIVDVKVRYNIKKRGPGIARVYFTVETDSQKEYDELTKAIDHLSKLLQDQTKFYDQTRITFDLPYQRGIRIDLIPVVFSALGLDKKYNFGLSFTEENILINLRPIGQGQVSTPPDTKATREFLLSLFNQLYQLLEKR